MIKQKVSIPKPSSISQEELDALLGLYHGDVYRILGIHQLPSGEWVVRAFFPEADTVEVVSEDATHSLGELERMNDQGFFSGVIQTHDRCAYQLRVTFGDTVVTQHDPYSYLPLLDETDLYLFGEGTNERLYQWLGAHVKTIGGVEGTLFSVWAPNAQRVSVVGDFNYWDGRRHLMRKRIPSGVWEIFIPGVSSGAHYKYEILGADGHLLPHKADPLGFAAECPPQTASRVLDECRYEWNDDEWLKHRAEHGHRHQAVSIYEVHLGSWRRKIEDDERYLTYRELAEELVPYVKDLGFSHIQLMPVSEFPFDGSWGYQPVGLFAPTSRFGSPDDFKYFVDRCHQAGIGVLIDWVPGHFPSDGHGLANFDGTPLYEHADPRQGFHPDWNTYIYNYGRREVANFLFSNALFWFDRYHIDGLRVDAVASMLYLDYSREAGEWIPNEYGGRENLEAINLIKRVNEKVHEYYPDAMMVAEESTAWPGVSHPTYAGGLGFGYKWNMGWMNDSLRYMSNDPVHRSYHHHEMTFSLLYAFNENFILPLSHDEVVHGKGSLLDKMPGDGWQKFANLRAYFAFMWTHPGKKLLFMGGEFAQGREWNHDASLDWHLLDIKQHQGVKQLIHDLNTVYHGAPSLYRDDLDSECFEWVDADNRDGSIFAFIRKGSNSDAPILVVSNMTPVIRQRYRVGVPSEGFYKEVLNSDADIYGGSDVGNAGGVLAEKVISHGREWSLEITLPPLSTLIFQLAID